MLNIYSCRQTQRVECERDFHNIRSLQYTWALITSTLTVQYSCLSVCIRATLLLVYEENKEKQEVAAWLVRMMQSEKEKSMQSIDKVCTLCATHTQTFSLNVLCISYSYWGRSNICLSNTIGRRLQIVLNSLLDIMCSSFSFLFLVIPF